MTSAAALPAIVDRGAQRHALRLAFGVTACFAIAEGAGWDYSFVAPMLAAQMLAGPRPPKIGQSLALLVIIAVAAGIVLMISATFVDTPPVLILALGLLLYLSFYGHLRGAPQIVTLMVQICSVSIPVVVMSSPVLGATLVETLFRSALIASVMVWAAHAAFPAFEDGPAAAGSGAGPPPLPERIAARHALRNTLIMLPVLLLYLVDTDRNTAIALLIVVVSVLRVHTPSQAAMGYILGNLFGGLAAALAYGLIQLHHTIFFFTIVCLVASLMFAARIVTGGPRAVVYSIAFAAFLILLGIGIAPVGGGSGSAFVTRIISVMLAAAYTIGALSLFRGSEYRPA